MAELEAEPSSCLCEFCFDSPATAPARHPGRGPPAGRLRPTARARLGCLATAAAPPPTPESLQLRCRIAAEVVPNRCELQRLSDSAGSPLQTLAPLCGGRRRRPPRMLRRANGVRRESTGPSFPSQPGAPLLPPSARSSPARRHTHIPPAEQNRCAEASAPASSLLRYNRQS